MNEIKVNEKDLQDIKIAFTKMYNSLVTINYCKGGTAGRAKQKALDQMSAFVENKTKKNHPMNEYLKRLNSEHRKTTSEQIMKSSLSNDVFNDALAAQHFGKMADAELKSSLISFNNVYRKYQVNNDMTVLSDMVKQMLLKQKQLINTKSRGY